jgi:hypothetical protein
MKNWRNHPWAGSPPDHSSASYVCAGEYSSIQGAVDKNPGTMIYIAAGFHDLRFSGNMFDAGCRGIRNVPLPE